MAQRLLLVADALGRTLVAVAVGGRDGVVEYMALVGHGKLLIAVAGGHEVTRVVGVDGPRVGGIDII